MLIKNYSSQIHQTPNHSPLLPHWPYSFQYKWLKLFFDPDVLSPQSHSPEELNEMFLIQQSSVEREIKQHEKYKFISKVTSSQTTTQYANLFFYQWYSYDKKTLLQQSATHSKISGTITAHIPTYEEVQAFINPPAPTHTYIEQDLGTHIEISRKSIRNLTGYSSIIQKPWHQFPTVIAWQEKLLTMTHDILVIDWSRQMGKSYVLSELLIEESFVPWWDILVGAFLQKTTNVILNYIKSFIRSFDPSDFSIFMKDGYIQNNTSGTKIHFRTLSDEGANVLWLTIRLVVLDEAQLIPTSTVEDAINPTLTTTWWRLILIGTSTENIQSYMYDTMINYKRGLMYNNPDQFTCEVLTISADQNPLIEPKIRKYINDNKDKPSIQRQYFNRWGKDADSRFNPKTIPLSQLPDLDPQWHIIHAMDPARKKDRSAYVYWHAINNILTLIVSDEVPAHFKPDWTTQAQFYSNLSLPYKTKFKSFSSVMDVTGVWDAVATIFREQWYNPTYQIRYTSWSNKSQPFPQYYHVAKHILLNNFMDMCEANQIVIIDETNKKLMEEISYASIEENKFWTLSLHSKFFDDILNAALLLAFIAKEERYIYRTSSTTQQSTIYNPDWLKNEQALYLSSAPSYHAHQNKSWSHW